MILLKNYDLIDYTNIINKPIHITSDCTFFPQFDFNGTICNVRISKNNIIFDFNIFDVDDNIVRTIKVDSQMNNLRYEFI